MKRIFSILAFVVVFAAVARAQDEYDDYYYSEESEDEYGYFESEDYEETYGYEAPRRACTTRMRPRATWPT